MKEKYTQPIFRVPESDAKGLYFKHKPYNIEPTNMEKRIRVYINQLLPDILESAKTVDDIKFSIDMVEKHYIRFTEKLREKGLMNDIDKVYDASLETLTALQNKLIEAIKNEQRTSDFKAK